MPGKAARASRADSNRRSRLSGRGKFKGSKSRARYHYKAASSAARKKNPTKAERAVASQKAAVKRRVAVALAKYLKQQNPGVKLAGAKVQKLKGGVIKITPVKANSSGLKKAWDRYMKEGLTPRVRSTMERSYERAQKRIKRGGKDYYRDGR